MDTVGQGRVKLSLGGGGGGGRNYVSLNKAGYGGRGGEREEIAIGSDMCTYSCILNPRKHSLYGTLSVRILLRLSV